MTEYMFALFQRRYIEHEDRKKERKKEKNRKEQQEEERLVVVVIGTAVDIPSLLEFWIIMGWFHCCIALVILTIEFLLLRLLVIIWKQSGIEGKWMNCFEGYLERLSFSLFDHHVQTSVMNVDCARKGTLFLSLAFVLSYSFNAAMCTRLSRTSLAPSASFSPSFAFTFYRVQYPFSSSMYIE
jgi:hypothetical protein